MESIASELKNQRERLNISLEQIASDTRISLHHLENLENGRYDNLPGGMYNRAIIRTLCSALQLDTKEMLQRYEAEVKPPPEKPEPVTRHRLPSTIKISPVAICSVIFIISATGIFVNREWINTTFSPYFSAGAAAGLVEDMPERQPLPADAAASASATNAENAPATPDHTDAPVSQVETTYHSEANGAPVEAAVDNQAAALRLEIVGIDQCWFSVNRDDEDENAKISKLLQAGETEAFSASHRISLVLGNAGGVQVRINGHKTRPLGKNGEVVRLTIDANNLVDLIDHSES